MGRAYKGPAQSRRSVSRVANEWWTVPSLTSGCFGVLPVTLVRHHRRVVSATFLVEVIDFPHFMVNLCPHHALLSFEHLFHLVDAFQLSLSRLSLGMNENEIFGV